MYCYNCGAENRDDVKFCTKCGSPLEIAPLDASKAEQPSRVELSAQDDLPSHDEPPAQIEQTIVSEQPLVVEQSNGTTPPMRTPWKVLATLLIVALAIGATVFLVKFLASKNVDVVSAMASPEESFEQYSTLYEGISSVESSYLDNDGYVTEDDVPRLIEDVAAYVENLPDDMVASYDVGDDYVQVDLTSGVTYVYTPRMEHMLNRGDGMTLGLYQQQREEFSDDSDNAIDYFDLRAEPAEHGMPNNSFQDAIAQYIVRADPNRFHLEESFYDEDVTLDVIKELGSNQLILWEGHGVWTEELGAELQLMQKVDFLWWKKRWGEDFTQKRVVVCGDGRIAVTPAFFDYYYDEGQLQDSVIYLGSCHSLQDDRLASALVDKGARLVIGNTNSVSTLYQFEMRDSILSDMADCRMPVSQALDNARHVYGDEDPWCAAGENTKVAFYPSNAGSVTLHGAGDEQLPREGEDTRRTNYEYVAFRFVYVMYNDWTFGGGHDNQNANPFPGRCLKYIDRESGLYSEFVEAGTSMTSKYSKEAATCVTESPQTTKITDRTYRVTVNYIAAQNSVDQAMYDRMLQDVSSDTWEVSLSDACKVTGLKRVSTTHAHGATSTIGSGPSSESNPSIGNDTVEDSPDDGAGARPISDATGEGVSQDSTETESGADEATTPTENGQPSGEFDYPESDSQEADSSTTSDFDGKQYWVVFTEGFRGGRVEASSFNVKEGEPTLVWDTNLTVSGATVDGNVSQFRLTDDGSWEKIGEYDIPTDWALDILATNVTVVDSSGQRIDVSSSY